MNTIIVSVVCDFLDKIITELFILVSNSPSPVKKTGNSQRAFELAGELYSCIQQWNLLISTGRAIISNILKLKTESW